MKPITTYTFLFFWNKFHRITKQPKPSNITQARKLWNDCNWSVRKVRATKCINEHIKISALNYLKLHLNKY